MQTAYNIQLVKRILNYKFKSCLKYDLCCCSKYVQWNWFFRRFNQIVKLKLLISDLHFPTEPGNPVISFYHVLCSYYSEQFDKIFDCDRGTDRDRDEHHGEGGHLRPLHAANDYCGKWVEGKIWAMRWKRSEHMHPFLITRIMLYICLQTINK